MATLLNRRRYMGGSSLPYEEELDYIECTGTQYINTNVLVEPISDGYEYSVNFINDIGGTRSIAGLWEYRYDSSHLCFSVVGNYGSKFYGFPKNWRGGGYPYAALGDAGKKADVSVVNLGDYDGSSMTMKVASPLLNQDVVFDNPYINKAVFPFIIGAIWSGNGAPAEFAHVRIYSFKLIRFNTPIFDGIPVRVGTEGYLYDKVSKQLFGNSGTGSFVLGYKPDKDKMIEIEYLGSNGGCVINTGYIPTGNDVRTFTKVTFNGYVSSSYVPWFMAYTSENADCFRVIRNDNKINSILINNGSKAYGGSTSFSVSVGTTYTMELSMGSYNINGVTGSLSMTEGSENTAPLSVFGELFKGNFYYFKMYKSDELALDLIPVRVGTTGFMYDKVSDELFGNEGTGSFILGPEKT